MTDTIEKTDLRAINQGLLVDLLEAGFSKEQIEAMPEPQWSLLIARLGLQYDEVEAFRSLYNEVTNNDLSWSDFRGFFEKENNTITLNDLSRVLGFSGVRGKKDFEIKKILQRYKGGRMAGISHTRLLEILPKNPDFELNVYISALEDGVHEPLAFELASMIAESAYEQFVIAKSAGIPEADLMQYIRTDLPPLVANTQYLFRPIETYVYLRTSEYALSHAEALEVIARLGGNPNGSRLYLTLRNAGCSHRETVALAAFTFVQDLLVSGDSIGFDAQKSIKVSRLLEILAMPAGTQVSLFKAITFYSQD